MTIRRYRQGQPLNEQRLNELVRCAVQSIVGGDGVQVSRVGNSVTVGLHRLKGPRGLSPGGSPAAVTGFSVGDMKPNARTDDHVVNSHRWLSCCELVIGARRTVGDASSGATAWASAGADDIFTHLWTCYANAKCQTLTSAGVPVARGGSAAADFAAHRRIELPDPRDRYLVGIGYTRPAAGDNEGADDAARSPKIHGHNGAAGAVAGSLTGHTGLLPHAGASTGTPSGTVTVAAGTGSDAADAYHGHPITGPSDHDLGASGLFAHDPSGLTLDGAYAQKDNWPPHWAVTWFILAEVA